MMRRKNLERAVILGLLLSTSVYGSAWAEAPNVEIIKTDEFVQSEAVTNPWNGNTEIRDGYDLVVNTDKVGVGIGYNGIVNVVDGDLTVNSSSNSIQSGYSENAEVKILANNVILNAGTNGIFTTTESGYASTVILGSEDRNITNLTINAGGQGIDNKNGNVYIYGADDSEINIHTNGTSGTGYDIKAAIHNEISSGTILVNGGTISLSADIGDGINNTQGTTTLNSTNVSIIAQQHGINKLSGNISLNTQGHNTIIGEGQAGIYAAGSGKINVVASVNANSNGWNDNTELGNSDYSNTIIGDTVGIDSAKYIFNGGGTVNVIADNNNTVAGNNAIYAGGNNNRNDKINIIAGNNNYIGGRYELNGDKLEYIGNSNMGVRVMSGTNSQININSVKGQTDIYGNDGISVANSEGSSVNVTAGTNINIVSQEHGIYVTNSTRDEDNIVNLIANGTNKVNVDGKDNDRAGLYSQNNSQIKLDAQNNEVSLTGSGTGNAIESKNKGSQITLEADNYNKILANSTDELTVADNIAYGDKYAVNASNSGTVDINAGLNNTVFGAVYATGDQRNGGGVVNIGKLEGASSTFSRSGNGEVSNNVYSAAVIESAGDIDTESAVDSNGNTNKFKDKKFVSALYAANGASVNLTGENTVHTWADSGDDDTLERTVWAYSDDKQVGSNINLTGAVDIRTDSYDISPKSADVAVAAGTATGLTEKIVNDFGKDEKDQRSVVNIKYTDTGKANIIEGDILAAYAGEVNITAFDENSRAANNAGIAIKGNLLAGNNGVLNVDLGKGGVLNGRADDYGDAGVVENSGHGTIKDENGNTFYNPAFSSDIYKGGEVTLNMGDGSRWNVQGQSWITNVNTNGNVTIDLTNVAEEYQNYNSHALTIRNLNGNANIKMDLNGDRSQSDMLYIGQGNGEYNIELAELVTVDDMYAQLDDNTKFSGLRFATVGAGSDVKFNVTAKDQGFNNVIYTVDTDVYNSAESAHENNAYNGENMTEEKPGNSLVDDLLNGKQNASTESGIATLAANDVMLLADENDTENDNKTQHLNYKLVDMQNEEVSDAGKTMLNMSRANYSNAIYMDRLNKRLGEARYINDDPEEDEGMWVRIRHDRIGKEDAFRSQNTMYELGYDKRQECDNGKRRVGFAVDYMHGDTGYSDIAGKGEIDRYGLWLYDTWTGNKGHYADYVAKWGHLQNDFEVYTMTGGEKVTGDYSNNVFSISAEYGRKKDMGNDWYIEPQAQLQLARVTGADYTTSQGTKVSVDGINSLIGRAGFRLGKDFGEEKQSTVYFKADVLHEFLGDQTIRAMDGTTDGWQTVDYENKGTWYDIGIGYAAMLSQSTYAFIDLEQSFGNDNDDTYQINAGVRWTF